MRQKIFEEYPIPKAIMTLATPTILGMIITVFYNMADTFFVGQTGDANQVAAVSLCMPIFFVLMAIGTIFGIGGGTYVSRLLGTKQYDKVKSTSAFCFWAAIGAGIICIGLAFLLMPWILKISGATPATYEYAKGYLSIIAIGSPAVVLQFSTGQMLRSEGATKYAMIGMVTGNVLNIILDPIFILSLGMGTSGAAIATIISNTVSILYYLFYFLTKNTTLSINPKFVHISKDLLINIFKVGIPASLNSLLMSFANLLLNNFAAVYGENVLASIGIAFRVNQVPCLILIGLAQGTQPFMGYNFARGDYKRMNKAFKFDMLVGMIFGSICCVLLFIFAPQITKVFLNNNEVINLCAQYIRIYATSLPIIVLQFVCMQSLQAFGKGAAAMIVSISRQGLAFIPSLFLFNYLFASSGLVWAQPVSDFITIVISVLIYISIYKKLEKESKLEYNKDID